MTSPNLPKTMDLVRKFSFDHGLLGEGAKTVDAVGIEFPAGKTLGNAKAIKMRFDPTYTKQAVDGAL
jgi:NitT/TauT family transport system substrate-binding protein